MSIPVSIQLANIEEAEVAVKAVRAYRAGEVAPPAADEASLSSVATTDDGALVDRIEEALRMYPPLSASKAAVLKAFYGSEEGEWVSYDRLMKAIVAAKAATEEKASDIAAAVLRDFSYQMNEKLPPEFRAGLEVLATRSRSGKSTQYRLTPAGRKALKRLLG